MEDLFGLAERPTAIMCTNDLTAIGALRTIRRHALSVPEDLSVVGFDDIDMSDIIQPPLTTVRLSREDLAQAFYTALSEFGNDPHVTGREYCVTSSLVHRGSTGPVC